MSRIGTLNRLGLMSIASALALCMVSLPSLAWSADKNQDQWQLHGQSHQQQNRGQAQNYYRQPNNPQQNRQFTQQHNNQTQFNRLFTQQHNSQPQFNRQFVQQKNSQPSPQWNQHRYSWSDYRPGHRPPQWDQHRHDVDIHAYNWNRTSAVRYHYRPYEPPQGFYYRRWVYGEVLPTIFWSQNYWLTDYYSFGLVNPPYGFVWVRYGPDALLVDVYSGQIISVEYNVFYA